MTPARSLRVAAVQVESHVRAPAANLANAEPFVDEAAARGAQLVLCPEFLAAGYIYDESIWESGEPKDGPTESWLCRLAAHHRLHVGASYLEVDGADFFNTFALAAPDGSIAGRVRKESLPAFEGWFFRSSAGPKSIDTELGRIGVGICQDNHTARFMRHMKRDRPDLILMPHSAPCFPGTTAVMTEGLTEIAPFYARSFGVPTVLVNKVHSRTSSSLPGVPFLDLPFDFPGLSRVVDSDGRVLDRAEPGEGIAVADVALDPRRKHSPPDPSGYWSRPPSRFRRLGGLFFVAMEELGKRAYARSEARIRAARAITTREVSFEGGAGARRRASEGKDQ